MSADLYGESGNGIYRAWWHITTNAANTQFTVEAEQIRVSDGALVSGPGQIFSLALIDDGDTLRTFDLWAAGANGIVNAGPKTRNIPLRIQNVDGGVESLEIEGSWRAPSSVTSARIKG